MQRKAAAFSKLDRCQETLCVIAHMRQGDVRILRYMTEKNTHLKGPRGSETTATKSGMICKAIWLHGDEAEALRIERIESDGRGRILCENRSVCTWGLRISGLLKASLFNRV